MLHYRDMTFCSWEACPNGKCQRLLSKKEKERASMWWGGDDFPVALSDFTDCPYWKGETND